MQNHVPTGLSPIDIQTHDAQATQMMNTFSKAMLVEDIELFLSLFAEQVIFEFPYAPEGYAKQLEGIHALRQHLESLQGIIAFTHFSTPMIHLATDSHTFIAQFQGVGTFVATGLPYEQDYISVVTTCDGKITRYQDYWNPLVLG
ncbi:nuclear transport factor 2 family protein [Paenibacillus sp. PK4536]|uniref:SnoaL-like domain-containing protein n=1 Tax=Paenibacillus nuruki TaxID=1886670 RepID=A0A1E3L7D1_9BACL|nr:MULTISPECIES: nuclear transport factor 2 family protein [Paenibacillus]ODP29679.1 uncharacterized protein PTI45_01162 [Paenibacillus nuruki]WIM40160.1 nuclear transport factor 2 family protein [Paenibacillus sp. PK4536]